MPTTVKAWDEEYFRRPYLFIAHRARRMERRMARAVSHGSMVGAGTVQLRELYYRVMVLQGVILKKINVRFHEATLLPVLEIVQAQRWVLS